jgi:Mn2+/Fe2+ NRAMP family transporter
MRRRLTRISDRAARRALSRPHGRLAGRILVKLIALSRLTTTAPVTPQERNAEHEPSRGILRSLGPGLLLAATAVGVSHLVQSTRAGADYGAAMAIFILLAMATKYPAYKFAPQYTAATGLSMLEGFRRQGLWALLVFVLVVPVPAIIGIGAVTIVTAGVAKAALELAAEPLAVAGWISAITAVLLIAGRYHWLDRLTKLMMLLMTVTTLAATALILPLIDWELSGRLWPERLDLATLLFTAALIGWMPAPLESAVMHSLWTQAKDQDAGYRISGRESSVDFHIGYVATLVLAVCFVLLGTGVMHGRRITFEESAGGFAAQVIALYTGTLGDWSFPLIGACALAVMYSTVISATDGFARIFTALILRFRGPEEPGEARALYSRGRMYVVFVVLICAGAMSILLFFMKSFKALIDFATTLSFLTTPVLALLIHRSVTRSEVPAAARPGAFMRAYSWICIAALTAFSFGYLLLLLAR